MSNVVNTKQESKGYNLVDDKVTGVYVEKLAAVVSIDFKDVLIGEKSADGIDCGVQLSMEDMNEFCLMWLLIFDESVIKEDQPAVVKE
jgi:hypothetical protein